MVMYRQAVIIIGTESDIPNPNPNLRESRAKGNKKEKDNRSTRAITLIGGVMPINEKRVLIVALREAIHPLRPIVGKTGESVSEFVPFS